MGRLTWASASPLPWGNDRASTVSTCVSRGARRRTPRLVPAGIAADDGQPRAPRLPITGLPHPILAAEDPNAAGVDTPAMLDRLP